jgi:co-chaperonin GroES (HSP10)
MATVKGKIKPLGKKILVNNMYFGDQETKSGIIIANDNGKERGIYPRWAQVWAVGPDFDEEFSVGDWILVEHGRWTRGIEVEDQNGNVTVIRRIDNDCVMAVADERPSEF